MSVSDIDLINMFTKYMSVNRAGSSGPIYNNMISELNTQIIDLSGQLAVLDGQEETYNEQYISAKENPTKYGVFSGTTQDWVFSFFYFSYAIFVILFTIVLVKNSKAKAMTAILVVGLGLFITLIVTVLLLAYA
jgi:VIT1/CCC1 family predicted Fe2+/Mn2+ transporter